jgi:hypothetical protein
MDRQAEASFFPGLANCTTHKIVSPAELSHARLGAQAPGSMAAQEAIQRPPESFWDSIRENTCFYAPPEHLPAKKPLKMR